MNKSKRITIATIFGVVFGFVCFALASSGTEPIAWPIAVQIIISRTLIGFAIGISILSMVHWSLHGIIMGLIFSLPIAFSGLMAPENPEYTPEGIFISTIVLGMIYGLLIELITSILFKARIQS